MYMKALASPLWKATAPLLQRWWLHLPHDSADDPVCLHRQIPHRQGPFDPNVPHQDSVPGLPRVGFPRIFMCTETRHVLDLLTSTVGSSFVT